MATIAGASEKGGSNDNQDTFFFLSGGRIKVFSVFDGHGIHGKEAADLAKNIVKKFFDEAKGLHGWSKDQHTTNMKKLFDEIHSTMKELFQTKKWKYGGTTATIVVIIHNDDGSHDIVTSNVGDSTAMIFGEDSKYDFLSENHNPDSKKEFERIRDLDGKEYPSKFELVYETQQGDQKIFDNDGIKISKFLSNPRGNGLTPINVRYEPATRAVGGNDEIRIAMTRSIGDFRGEKYGLSHTPTVTFKKAPKGCMICVASDGLWDNWKYEDLSCYLTKLKDKPIESVLSETMTETMTRGTTNFGEKNVDDTTCVLCRMGKL
jgi:serine/threonine protein phosphatase PrpC